MIHSEKYRFHTNILAKELTETENLTTIILLTTFLKGDSQSTASYELFPLSENFCIEEFISDKVYGNIIKYLKC